MSPLCEDIMKKNLITFRTARSCWQINFIHPNKKRQRIRRDTQWGKANHREARKEAVELYRKHLAQKDNPNLFDTYTLLDAVNEYLEEHPNEKRYLKPTTALIGHKGLKQITRADYSLIIKKCKDQGNSNKTINRKLDPLRATLNLALDNEWIESFPKIKRLKESKDDIGIRLSKEDQARLEAVMTGDYAFLRDPFLFALSTGLRLDNIVNLKRKHLTMEGRRLHFQASEMKANKSHTLVLTETDMAIIKRNISNDSNYIFKGYKGQSNLGNFNKSWATIRKLSGVKCRWHDLRHTCASELAESGIINKELMDIMAWSDIRTAMRYTHLAEGRQLSNRQKREESVHQSVHQRFSTRTKHYALLINEVTESTKSSLPKNSFIYFICYSGYGENIL